MPLSRNIVFSGIFALSALAVAGGFGASKVAAADKPKLVMLTQVGCQFIESEPTNHMFKTKKFADCEAINKKTGKDRYDRKVNRSFGNRHKGFIAENMTD